jgi:tetratricopeptide (TPR) repeat protein
MRLVSMSGPNGLKVGPALVVLMPMPKPLRHRSDKKENNVVSFEDAKARKLFHSAYQAHLSGLLDEAINLYMASLALARTPQALTFLAWALSAKNEFERAIELCKQAIELDPDYGNPYNDIGAYLIELNKEDEAIQWLEKALAAKNYDCPFYPYFNLGRIYKNQSLIKKAITCFKKALSLNSEFFAAQKEIEELSRNLN